jgi:hypothetical protein
LRRLSLWVLAAIAVSVMAVLAAGYRSATAMPIVRRLVLTVPTYPATGAPFRIVLFSDLHVQGPDMPPERVERIVEQINALHPDIDIAAGDFMGDDWLSSRYPPDEAIAPLARLKAKSGVYAVLGNKDYQLDNDDVARALKRAGIRVLIDEAVQVGPVELGGMDGRVFHAHKPLDAARQKTYEALGHTGGVKILIAHRPDEVVTAPDSISLVVAGHTHCGQIVLPLLGALETGSDFGRKYLCGVIRDGPKLLVVTAGLGTSRVPLRIGAPPDIWLISVKGPARGPSQK